MPKREPETKAVQAAHAEFAALGRELRAVKGHALAASHRFKTLAKTGEVIAKVYGKPYTLEHWIASAFRALAQHDGLAEAIAECGRESRGGYRAGVRYYLEDCAEDEARIAAKRDAAGD